MADNALVQTHGGEHPPGASNIHVTDWKGQLARLMRQPALLRSLPLIVGLAGLSLAGILYLTLAQGPQKVLYSDLSDRERASVVATLEQNGLDYTIDGSTGIVRVAEADIYRARMLMASDGGLAAPDAGTSMLDAIPMGASRTLEGERLRLAREHELQRTIIEIDGIEAARVHLATPERSVFVRENGSPSASVMVRLARGRELASSQVKAIINLVAGSVPGLASANVRVVDQAGRLLTGERESDDGAASQIEMQQAIEAKMRDQLAQLLAPLLGEGNFSTEVQVTLNFDDMTSARESYDKDGTIRQESESRTARLADNESGGVPGVLANSPPPPAQLVEGSAGTERQVDARAPDPVESDTSANRTYEIGREVAVTTRRAGGLESLSVAVAVSEDALAKIAPADADQLRTLIEAAVGADADRGDRVEVMVGHFEPIPVEEPAFYVQPWFAMAARHLLALIAVILVMLLVVRPIVKSIRRRLDGAAVGAKDSTQESPDFDRNHLVQMAPDEQPASISERVTLARRLAVERPEHAATALKRMLATSAGDAQ